MNIRPFGQRSRGCVYLVGAGPGDPELLTLKAVRLLERADVIVYDNLVSSGVLDFASPDAQRIFAGKRRNEHTLRQEQSTGSLEVGKQADLLVLDKNIFDLPTKQIGKAKVLWTLLGGEEVYRNPEF